MSGTPAACAIPAIASRSVTTPPGLARLSTKIALHLGVSAVRKFSGSSGSTKMTFQPNFLKLRPNWVIEPP
jgi:hypothetical protein